MKQFFLASTIVTAVPEDGSVTTKGQLLLDDKGDRIDLIVGNGDDLPVDIVPLFKENLSYTVTTPTAGAKYKATITIPASPVAGVDYVFQVVKGGAVFNERNVFTSSISKTAKLNTAALMAKQLAKQLGAMTDNTGLKVTVNAAVITLEAKEAGVNYFITGLIDKHDPAATTTATPITPSVVTQPVVPVADNAWVKELAHKCIGDKGIGYTHVEAMFDTYHAMNNKAADITAATYDIVNIRVYNPRVDHRVDESLYHLVHIACAAGNGTTIANALKTANTPGTSLATDND